MFSRAYFRLLACSIPLFLAACGLMDLLDPEPNEPTDRVVVGTVLALPEIMLQGDLPGLEEMTAASVFVGKRGPGADILLMTPEPLTGASVTLTIIDDVVSDATLPHIGDGFYATTSEETDELRYGAGASFRTTIVESGRTYEIDVDRAPSPEQPSGIPAVHRMGEPLSISWAQRRTALVEVYRASASGPIRTYSNRPSDIRELVLLALEKEPDDPSLEIPAEAFSGAGRHVLVFFLLKRGFPDSGLFAGSTLLVGAGSATTLEVGP